MRWDFPKATTVVAIQQDSPPVAESMEASVAIADVQVNSIDSLECSHQQRITQNDDIPFQNKDCPECSSPQHSNLE